MPSTLASSSTPALPTPTVTRGAVMQHDNETGRMTGMKVGEMVGGAHANMDHGTPSDTAKATAAGHQGHTMTPPATAPTTPATAAGHQGHVMPATADSAKPHLGGAADPMHAVHHPEVAATAKRVLDMQRALLRDPVIRQRIMADTALRQLMLQSFEGLSAGEREELQRLLRLPARPVRR
jgi:hypothetical protein